MTPLWAHYKCHGWTRQPVVPVQEDPDTANLPGVHELAKQGGDLSQRFGRFVQENLCMESWDFILDAVQYEMVSVSQSASPSASCFCRAYCRR